MSNIFNRDKFTALVHYICEKAENPAVLGAIKLNKVLWYSDVIHYLLAGEPMTGETYVKRQHGPVPRHIMPTLDLLVEEGKIARGRVDHFGFIKNEYISLLEPDTSMFTRDEIVLIDKAFDHVCMNHTATSISEETHTVIWELAEMGEELPYNTVFAISVGEIDEDDISWAKGVMNEAA